MTADEAFIDQHHAAGLRVVEILKVAAEPDRNPERVEVAGTDVREPRHPAVVSGEARDAKEMSPGGAAERHMRRGGRGGDARHRPDFAGQQPLKRDPLLERECGGLEIQKRDRDGAVGFEAGVDRRQVPKALDKEQRRDDQYQRHGDLADNESALKSGPVAIESRAARHLPYGLGGNER